MYKHWDTSLRVIETVRNMRPETAPAYSGCGTSLRAASAEALLRSQNSIWWIGDMLRAIAGLLYQASFSWIEVTAGLWEECMQLPWGWDGKVCCVLNHMQGVWLGLCASGSWSLKGLTMQQPHGPQGQIEGHARCPAQA